MFSYSAVPCSQTPSQTIHHFTKDSFMIFVVDKLPKSQKNLIKKCVFCKKNYVKFQNPKNFAVILESDLVRIQGFSNTGQNGIQEHWREYWNTRYWKLDEIILEFQDWIEYCNTEIGLNENFKKCFCIKAHYSVKNPVQNTNFSIPNTKYIIPNNSDMYEVCITLNGDDA